MNPLTALKDVVPKLASVLESIHAHLEQLLEESRVTNKLLIKINEQLHYERKSKERTSSNPQDNDNNT